MHTIHSISLARVDRKPASGAYALARSAAAGLLIMLSSACMTDENPDGPGPDSESLQAAVGIGGSDAQSGSSCGTGSRCDNSDDCAPVCGNGVLDRDAGEECDPGIAGWSQACSSNCKQLIYQKPCSSNSDCTITPGSPYTGNMVCGGTHVCIPVCMTPTPSGETAPPSVCPAVPTYSSVCFYPFCFLRCSSADDCPDGTACTGNICGNLN